MTRIVAIGECMVDMAPSWRAGDTMNPTRYLRELDIRIYLPCVAGL